MPEYLNLVGTKVTENGVLQLKGLKALHSLFLFQTSVDKGVGSIQNTFPQTQIDSVGYLDCMLATDIIVVKAKKNNDRSFVQINYSNKLSSMESK